MIASLFLYLSSAAEQMDQVSNRSGVGNDDIIDETASLADSKWNSDDDDDNEVIKTQRPHQSK